jgi:leucyl-tRNA synthetase
VAVWVGNYVLMSYGDGAVMGVPAHDERDFAFALKYQLAYHAGGARSTDRRFSESAWQEWYADQSMACASTLVNSMVCAFEARGRARWRMMLQAKGLGEKKTTWRLRDWGVSRQRYWGTPIPIIHCDVHGAVPVPEKDLPVVLPQDCMPDGSGNPLHKHEGFHAGWRVPTCGKPARRETDTMDTFVRFVLVLHALLRPDQHRGHGGRWHETGCASSEATGGSRHGPVHRRHRARHPAPAVCALLDQGDARLGTGEGR